MENFHPVFALSAFLGGWCGTVPISVIIWWIIHHHHGTPPPPPPDPWWKVSIIGAVVGAIVGTLVMSSTSEDVTSMSIVASSILGFTSGAIAGGIVARGTLSSFKNK
jgi:drug/metabolite transporter (DMT)-like permease